MWQFLESSCAVVTVDIVYGDTRECVCVCVFLRIGMLTVLMIEGSSVHHLAKKLGQFKSLLHFIQVTLLLHDTVKNSKNKCQEMLYSFF